MSENNLNNKNRNSFISMPERRKDVPNLISNMIAAIVEKQWQMIHHALKRITINNERKMGIIER